MLATSPLLPATTAAYERCADVLELCGLSDLANRRAGGSEVLVDQLATGLLARGHHVTLLCAGPVAERPYLVRRNGGTYSQFLRAPLAYLRNLQRLGREVLAQHVDSSATVGADQR